MLSSPAPSFTSLLKPLLTPQTIPNTLIVILLDWSQPWAWMRQLREWLLLLRTVIMSLSHESKEVMEETMLSWRDRGRTGGLSAPLDIAGVDPLTGWMYNWRCHLSREIGWLIEDLRRSVSFAVASGSGIPAKASGRSVGVASRSWCLY